MFYVNGNNPVMQMNYNGNDVNQFYYNNNLVWKKPEQKKPRVTAKTNSLAMSDGSNAYYGGSGEVDIGKNQMEVTISAGIFGNTIRYNPETGIANYSIYGLSANSTVSATIHYLDMGGV